MTRDVPFNQDDECDICGQKGAFDFMGDCYCQKCLDLKNAGCPECANNAHDGMDFCAYCGKNLTGKRVSVEWQYAAKEMRSMTFKEFIREYDAPPNTCTIGKGTLGFKMTHHTLETHMHRAWQAAVRKTKEACREAVLETLEDCNRRWPCQDLHGGRPSGIYDSIDGMCQHQECHPINNEKTVVNAQDALAAIDRVEM